MRIGIPREIKNHEYRVAITPAGVLELTGDGHYVAVEAGAGVGSTISDEEYAAAGAIIAPDAATVWGASELVLKVKEPIAAEYELMRPGQMLFTYLHLAASKECTDALIDRRITGIAYETVELDNGALPLLAPMSEIAGRLSVQAGAHYLMRTSGGSGVLIGGVPGVHPAKVVVIGGGVSGANAVMVAVGMGADVVLLDRNIDRLRQVDRHYGGRVRTVASNTYQVEGAVRAADLVIGAVLVPGAKAPTLVSNDLVSQMKPGSVLVDISIDQGGCFADSRPTTHADPVYAVHNSLMYCVANMPGAVPHTSTYALTNVTLPYVVSVANNGWRAACRADRSLALGLNTVDGQVVCKPVAQAHGMTAPTLVDVLN
jgi:alanine dehydrogenase